MLLLGIKNKKRSVETDLFYYQLIGVIPWLIKYSFARLKCLLPKNPLYAERGDGCADVKTRCLSRLINAPFFCA